MASPTLLVVPPTPRADATTSPAVILRPVLLNPWDSVHTYRTSSEATAETIFSLYGDDRNSWHSTKLRVSSATTPIASLVSNYRPMSTANGDSSLSYLRQSSASSRTSADSGTAQGRRESAPVACTQACTPYTTPCSIVARRYTSRVCWHTAPRKVVPRSLRTTNHRASVPSLHHPADHPAQA
jgi:hypothetical protein